MTDVVDRILSKVEKTETCWLWRGCIDKGGYGKIRFQKKTTSPHRVMYQMCIGPIPDGFEIDHVKARGCTNRNCVNPAHLEAVTPLENTRRSAAGQRMLERTMCPQGHEYNEENTGKSYQDGSVRRYCRTCKRQRCAAYYRKRKAEALV